MKINGIFCAALLLFIAIGSDGQVETKRIAKLTNIESSYPYWSPDGSQIVFQSNRMDDNSELYVMDADGRKIAFRGRTVSNIMGRAVGNSEVFIANRDGSGAYNITNHPEHNGWPLWSPDGKKIAFASERERGRNWQIYTINIHGTKLARLTEFDAQGAEFAKPQWSPEGDKILCTHTKDGNVEIYMIELG